MLNKNPPENPLFDTLEPFASVHVVDFRLEHNFVENHPMTIPTNFGSIWPRNFVEEY